MVSSCHASKRKWLFYGISVLWKNTSSLKKPFIKKQSQNKKKKKTTHKTKTTKPNEQMAEHLIKTKEKLEKRDFWQSDLMMHKFSFYQRTDRIILKSRNKICYSFYKKLHWFEIRILLSSSATWLQVTKERRRGWSCIYPMILLSQRILTLFIKYTYAMLMN